MKVTLLGATGRTGKHVLNILLQKGHSVQALVRDASKIKIYSEEQLFVLEGDTTNLDTLRTAMKGCEAVVSILNISRNSDFPWSGLRTPKTLISDTIRNAIIRVFCHRQLWIWSCIYRLAIKANGKTLSQSGKLMRL